MTGYVSYEHNPIRSSISVMGGGGDQFRTHLSKAFVPMSSYKVCGEFGSLRKYCLLENVLGGQFL